MKFNLSLLFFHHSKQNTVGSCSLEGDTRNSDAAVADDDDDDDAIAAQEERLTDLLTD